MFDRPVNRSLWTIAAIILCVILVGVAAGVLALNRQQRTANLLIVPDRYATIQEAINAAEPGDVIQVRAGIYNEVLTLDRAVSLIAETFNQVNPAKNSTILNSGPDTATITIAPNLTQMPTIRGFIIQGGNTGIQASSPFIAEFNFFRTSAIGVNYQWGSGGSNRNNTYFKTTDDAIHLDNIFRPLLIENNRIMYAGDDGIEANLQPKPSPPGPTDVNIWNNMIIGSREDGIQFIDFPGEPEDTNRRFVIAGNLIANNLKAGIGLTANANTVEDYSGADTVEAIRVYNNTLYGNNHGISGGDNLVAFNNIIVNSQGEAVWRVQGSPTSNSVVAYTLFYNNTRDADESTLGAGIIAGQDPLFAAAPNPGQDGAWETVDDDFSGLLLQGNSPAIDKGAVQYVAVSGEPVPPNPITGFIGAAPDLGWREFGSPIIITPTASPIPSPTFAALTASPVFTVTPITPTATVLIPSPVPATTVAPASPTLPAPTATLAPPTVTVIPQPAILSITPNTAQAGATVNLTVTGTGFMNSAVVAFEGGQGAAPQVVTTQVVNPTTIVITVDTNVDTAFGTQAWAVRVTNPDNSTVLLTNAFTVTASP